MDRGEIRPSTIEVQEDLEATLCIARRSFRRELQARPRYPLDAEGTPAFETTQ